MTDTLAKSNDLYQSIEERVGKMKGVLEVKAKLLSMSETLRLAQT